MLGIKETAQSVYSGVNFRAGAVEYILGHGTKNPVRVPIHSGEIVQG